MDNNQSDGKPKSGMDLKLAPGEKFAIKDTNYIIRNKGQFTTDLHIYTQEYELWLKEKDRHRRMTEGVGPVKNISQGKKYWVKVKGE